jgi:hypothetical protein
MSARIIRFCEHCEKPFRSQTGYNEHIKGKTRRTDSSSSSKLPVSAKDRPSTLRNPSSSTKPNEGPNEGPVASFWKKREKKQLEQQLKNPLPLYPDLHQGSGNPNPSAKSSNRLLPKKTEELKFLGLGMSDIGSSLRNKAHRLEEERRGGGSTRRNRQKYCKTKKTQSHRHTKHHRKTYRGRI